ncbi:MAG: acylphosphatase [Candidatus Omnitrophica bacterium]|nr:acylphosphatase [Candidatus Omnitrophota bacterium]
MVQAHIIYSGIVQGVGFRFTAQRFAKELDVGGWARNLSDGRVEIIAEGSKEKVQEFIDRLDEHFGHYIESRQINFSSSEGVLSDFSINQNF